MLLDRISINITHGSTAFICNSLLFELGLNRLGKCII
jgi:hypothetical protein